MLAPDVLALRHEAVVSYIQQLEAARARTWQDLFERYETELVAGFVLCHPGWYRGDPRLRAGLGLTGFLNVPARRGRCESQELWGYECPLIEHRIEADHLFPLALGGPAVGTNQIWLCQLHNQWKSSDLAAYPWERGKPAWLAEQITHISNIVAPAARLDL